MRLTRFWFVTAPGPESTLVDILGECSANGFIRQVRGGLSERDDVALFTNADHATAEAERRLKYRSYYAK